MAKRSFMRVRAGLLDSDALVRAGEAAEVLHLRALGWSAASDSAGMIPATVPKHLTPRNTRRRIAALEAYGLWRPLPTGGWSIATWDTDVRLEREPIALETRLAVYARDGWRCAICGSTRELQIDHIYPWSLGGSDDISNLQTLCRPCNRWKGARVL